jgi:hypothetical protein
MSAIVVRFSDADEFLAELAERPPDVEPIVRLTRRFIPAHSKQYGPLPYSHVQVVATYLRRGLGDADDPLRLVELTTYCGDRWPHMSGPNEEVDARAERVMALVQARAGQLGYAVAAGVYQPAAEGG